MMETYLYKMDSMDKWRGIINTFPPFCQDIYYHPEYYMTWAEHESADPMCLHIAHDGVDYLYPFFRKLIAQNSSGRSIYDIFSAYGYGGMIASIPASALPVQEVDKVNDFIDQWCKENGIVAEFIRHNPLFDGPQGPLRSANNAVVRQNVYRRYDTDRIISSASARRNIRKATKNGLKKVVDSEMRTVDDFNRLYAATAARIDMPSYYLFGEKYTASVARLMKTTAMLVNIELDKKILASAMIFKNGPYTTYHLSGSAVKCQKLYPNELLLSALIEIADSGPKSVLSFGGGLTCAKDDALFEFKNRFGNDTRPVFVGKNVHDRRQYSRLCGNWERKYPHLKEKYSNFFLKYRLVQ